MDKAMKIGFLEKKYSIIVDTKEPALGFEVVEDILFSGIWNCEWSAKDATP